METVWIANNPEGRLCLGGLLNHGSHPCAEYSKPLYMAFIDCEKAFDSVQTAAVVKALKDQEIEETYIRLVDDVLKGCMGSVTVHKKSDKFTIRKRVRQGDTISRKLFTACLPGLIRKRDWENTGLRVNGEYLSHLRFADDVVLLSEAADHLQKMLEEL